MIRKILWPVLIAVVAALTTPVGSKVHGIAASADGVISGRVVDEAGTPLPASIQATWDSEQVFGNYRKVQTDGEGHYELTGLPAGSIRVEVRTKEHLVVVEELQLDDAEVRRDVDFRLSLGGFLEGMILLPDGQPARGSEVLGDVGHPHRSQRVIVEEPTGLYRLGPLPPGPCGFWAFPDDDDAAIPHHVTLEVVAGETTRYDVRLRRGIRVLGQVVDSNGAGISGYLVHVGHSILRVSRRAWTDAQGQFVLEDVPPGSNDVSVIEIASSDEDELLSDFSRHLLEETISIADDEKEVEMTLTLDTDSRVEFHGRLIEGDVPLGGATVVFRRLTPVLHHGEVLDWDVTDTNGNFTLDIPDAGTGKLKVFTGEKPDHELRAQFNLEVPERPVGRRELQVPRRRVVGRVDRSALESGETWVSLGAWDRDKLTNLVWGAKVDGEGRFEIDGVGAGEYAWIAFHEPYGIGALERITIEEEGEVDLGTLKLNPSGVVDLDLELPADLKWRQIHVTLMGDSIWSRIGIDPLWYEIALPPGVYSFRIEAEGREDRIVSGIRVTAGETTEKVIELD